MSGLGLAAVGYQMGKQLDYDNRRRDFSTAQMDAEQPGLQDAAAARTSGNQLRTAQNAAELGLVPARSQLAGSQLGLAQGKVNLESELMPQQQDMARKKSDMLSQQTNQEYSDFGSKLRQERVSNAITQQEVYDKAFTKLADVLHTSQSPGQAVDFYNTIVDTGALGDLPGPKATSARMGVGPDGQEEISFFNGDKRIFGMNQATMGRYLARGQKPDIKTLKGGESLISVDPRTGKATSVFQAPESAWKKYKKLPAEAAFMDYLVEKGVAKDPSTAFSLMRTARGKGRAEAISEMIGKSLIPGAAPSEQDMRKMEDIYGGAWDRLNGGGRGAASNSTPPNTLDPKVQSLFE